MYFCCSPADTEMLRKYAFSLHPKKVHITEEKNLKIRKLLNFTLSLKKKQLNISTFSLYFLWKKCRSRCNQTAGVKQN